MVNVNLSNFNSFLKVFLSQKKKKRWVITFMSQMNPLIAPLRG